MKKKKRVIALGFFDGIHIGHAALMRRTVEIGVNKALIPSVLTFDAHPLSVICGIPVPLINSPEDRVWLIRSGFGIDDIVSLHFGKETAGMEWVRFIEYIAYEFDVQYCVAGHDFSFGNGGEGNSDLLKQKCAGLGMGCDIIPEVKLDGVTISSSYIRELISDGKIGRANEFLGHPHILTGIAHNACRPGIAPGTSTIILSFSESVIVPAFGVYIVKVFLCDGNEYVGVTNIGIRRADSITGQIEAEIYVLNCLGDLDGHQVRIEFHSYLHPATERCDHKRLKAQILHDSYAALRYFNM